MGTFTLHIETDNAAFSGTEYDRGHEIARILKETAMKCEVGTQEGLIKDLNGNTVGHFRQDGLEELD